MNIGTEFARLAREWVALKVPYQHRGTTRNGCDCTGLLIGIARELGFLKDYTLRQYPPDWNLHAGAGNQVIDELSRFADRISNSDAIIGDVAVMSFGKCPAHCGIMVGQLLMVHCYRDARCVKYAVLKNSNWGRRWLATYRWNREKLR